LQGDETAEFSIDDNVVETTALNSSWIAKAFHVDA